MSAHRRAGPSWHMPRRAAIPILIMLAAASIPSSAPALADRVPTVTTYDGAAARRAGVAPLSRRHHLADGDAVEVELPGDGMPAGLPLDERTRRVAARLLAVGSSGAFAIGDPAAATPVPLDVVLADGTVLRLDLAGAQSAAFGPGDGWLAVVDRAGRLWRLDLRGPGALHKLSDGPFAGTVATTADGSLLALAVPSVQAPYVSRLVRIDAESGEARSLTGGASLVFAASELRDGQIAIVEHRPGTTVEVRRIGAGKLPPITLPAGAVDVAIAPGGIGAAYAVRGVGVFVASPSGSRRVGGGDLPRFSPRGAAILVVRDGAAVAVDLHGALTDRFASAAVAWIPCDGRCAS